MGRRWTHEDVDELKRMARQFPAPHIAETTGRTVGAVTFKAHQLRVSLRTRRQIENLDPGPGGFGHKLMRC